MTTAASLALALADRYRIERELGQGGMATVYLAHDLRHDREVAIKVLHPDLGAALGADRFLTEIRTTARLQHPHILPLLDSGSADAGLLYYVMPLVTGETLRARLTRERQLPIADAVRLAREVASALDYAHQQGVIHRDIKPENILLQDGNALVADFGIALAVQQAGGQRLTQTGLSLGTPQYMSPEQAMGEKTIDPRTDIYALAAVTYEMLTGDPPFTGSSVQAVVAKVLSAEPERPTLVRKTIPVAVFSGRRVPRSRAGTSPMTVARLTALAQLQTALADRYRVERERGAGGMATVYLAHDLRHDRHQGPPSQPWCRAIRRDAGWPALSDAARGVGHGDVTGLAGVGGELPDRPAGTDGDAMRIAKHPDAIWFLNAIPSLRRMRQEARYQRLLERMGLPKEWRQ